MYVCVCAMICAVLKGMPAKHVVKCEIHLRKIYTLQDISFYKTFELPSSQKEITKTCIVTMVRVADQMKNLL